MTSNIIELSAHLRDELAQNSKPQPVDPRTVPLRFSTLKLVQQSPLHYWWAVQHGYDESLSMRIGTGAHAMLFGTPYVVWNGKRQGKAWEAFEAKTEKEQPGVPILNQSEFEKAHDMATAIRKHQTASRLLFTDTVVEKRIDWEWQGRAFRSTPDAAHRTTLIDLKCLRSAEPEAVKWQSKKMGYHVQAAVYRRCLNQTGQYNIKDCYLIVVENKKPHPVTVLRFTETALEAGDRTAAGWLEQVLACEAANSYPGYAQSIVDLDLPVTQDELIFDETDSEEQESEE